MKDTMKRPELHYHLRFTINFTLKTMLYNETGYYVNNTALNKLNETNIEFDFVIRRFMIIDSMLNVN